MKILVVYESLFGNTKTIAEAVAKGLEEYADVTVATVDEVRPSDVAGAALIVGGPTHIRGMVSGMSREAARKDKRLGPVLPGAVLLRDWVAQLQPSTAPAAAFDTRINKPAWLTGSAAKKIARLLRRKGYSVLASASFLVEKNGWSALADAERDRAFLWGRELGDRVTRATGG